MCLDWSLKVFLSDAAVVIAVIVLVSSGALAIPATLPRGVLLSLAFLFGFLSLYPEIRILIRLLRFLWEVWKPISAHLVAVLFSSVS